MFYEGSGADTGSQKERERGGEEIGRENLVPS